MCQSVSEFLSANGTRMTQEVAMRNDDRKQDWWESLDESLDEWKPLAKLAGILAVVLIFAHGLASCASRWGL